MSIPYNEASIPGRHTITYRVQDYHRNYPEREVEVLATREEIEQFVRDGYLVRERLVPMAVVERLQQALEECIDRDEHLERSGARTFGGVFIRHLMEKHAAFLELRDYPPTLSVARALFGPMVQVRGFIGRVCYPDDPHQEAEWHFHQRVIADPVPPMLARPHIMDVLLYLDELDDRNGPLCVLPGSHRIDAHEFARGDVSDRPGQVILRLPIGSCVLLHGNLWHRALPTQPGGTLRRLLLWTYNPCWMKPTNLGVRPTGGLVAQLLAQPDVDQETKELLGVAGFI